MFETYTTQNTYKGYAAKGALEIGIQARETEKKLALLAADYAAEMNRAQADRAEGLSLSGFLATLKAPFRQLATAGRRIFML